MTAPRPTAPLARLLLGAAMLVGAGCSPGGSDEASTTITTTYRSVVTATTVEPTTTTGTAVAAAAETSSTTTTTAPARRAAPPTSSSSTAPAALRSPAPKASTTTTATQTEVPAENLVPGSGPQFSTWTPPSDLAPSGVHTIWTPAPGVEMTPPYQAPALVGPAEYVGCTRHNDNNLWHVTVRATLTGGRYWRFPGSANGNTGLFSSIHQSMVGLEFDPDGFEGTISYVKIETGDGKHEDVPISPPLTFHCVPS